MDPIFLDGKAALHIDDTANYFSAARYLDHAGDTSSQSVKRNLNGISNCLVDYLPWVPKDMKTDQESDFKLNTWKQLTNLTSIHVLSSGVQEHISLRN